MTDVTTNTERSDDAQRRREAALLAAMGFEKCDYEPEEGDCCDRCGKENVQLYFGNRDYWTPADGDYWCLECIEANKKANDEWVDQMMLQEGFHSND